MVNRFTQVGYHTCLSTLRQRLAEEAPGRMQMLVGPRQVGKTTLLLQLLAEMGPRAQYVAADAAETLLVGYWERFWLRVEILAESGLAGPVVVLLDEVQQWSRWAEQLKAVWDRHKRQRLAVHIVLTGSSALLLGRGARESLAGRFEKTVLTHWEPAALADELGLEPLMVARQSIWWGGYPGAWSLRKTPARWAAYVRDAIVDPALGRDIVALADIRKPGLMRQIFAVASASPTCILSLAKLQGSLQDRGSLATVADYLSLLEQACLVACLPKYAEAVARRRQSPSKLITLNNAMLGVMAWQDLPEKGDPRFGAWVENACVAHAYNAAQEVSYWREGDQEVDFIVEGSWGALAIEVKTGEYTMAELGGLGEFVRRNKKFRGLILCDSRRKKIAERAGFHSMAWEDYLLGGIAGLR